MAETETKSESATKRAVSGLGARWSALRPRTRTSIAVGILLAGFAITLRGLLRYQGPPMEEGFMLVFPERILKGDIPNKDFLHLYGTGSLWVLAGVFKVFGTSLTSERLVALAQQMAVVFGIFALAWRWGRTAATLCAIAALLLIVPPIGLTALSWVGAVGLGLLGLAAALHARARVGTPSATRWALGAGVLFGFSLQYRPDLVLACVLGGVAATWGLTRVIKLRVVIGFILGLSPYLIQFATAGVDTSLRGMIIDPVFNVRAGRKLPIPPPWDHFDGFLQKAGDLRPLHWPIPSLAGPAQLFVWFFVLLASTVFVLAVGIAAVRRDRTSMRAWTLLGVAVFGLGITPQALQRPDSTHLAWVGCVSMAFVPIALLELRGFFRGRTPRGRGLIAGGLMLALLIFGFPFFTIRTYTDYSLQSFGIHRLGYPITNDGRTFYYGRPDAAKAARPLLREVDKISKPGDRLFVGTGDLRRTPYSDAYLYFLLPDLTPATYFIEMDPGVANKKGSGLDKDLASADIVILSKVWKDWDEPNDSHFGHSDAANKVLDAKFCKIGDYSGLYELFVPCKNK